MSEYLPALISASATLIVCMINNYYQNNRVAQQHAETITLIKYQIEELSKRVEKHNNVIERTALLEERVKVVNHRLDDLEVKR